MPLQTKAILLLSPLSLRAIIEIEGKSLFHKDFVEQGPAGVLASGQGKAKQNMP